MPTASIIIPTYNGEKTIDDAVYSILKQEYDNYEILIGDDKSTDQTPKILNTIREIDSRISVYHRRENLGIPENMNRLVDQSSGEILFFLDQDDYWLPGKLEKHIEKHKDNNTNIVFSNYINVDSNGVPNNVVSPPIDLASQGIPLIRQLYDHGNFLGTFSAVSIKSTAWETMGGLDKELSVSADFDLWIRLAGLYKFSHLNEVLVAKREHSQNFSKNHSLIDEDSRRILSKAINRYPSLQEHEDRIRSKLKYRHSIRAFRDGQNQEAIEHALDSLYFQLAVKPAAVLVLSYLNTISTHINIGAELYNYYSRGD